MTARLDGRYTLLERLGVGGMAEVWRARDERTRDIVAVKRLHPHLREDEAALDRFRREAAAAAAIRHERAIGLRIGRIDRDEAYLVMDFVPGGSLADRLARHGPMPVLAAFRIATEVGEALGHAHALGIVHRDVTPANVLFDADGSARLADFGIARPIDGHAVTAAGDLVGTLRALAPEILAGSAPTPASDVWSLGALLHEALSGRAPFAGERSVDLLAARSGPPPPLVGVPAQVNGLLARMLDPDPAARPPNGAAAAEALRAAAEHVAGPPASPDDATVVVPAALAGAPAPDRGRGTPAAPRRRHLERPDRAHALVAAAGAAVLLAFAALAAGVPTQESDRVIRTLSAPPTAAAPASPVPTAPPAADRDDDGPNDRANKDKAQAKAKGKDKGDNGRGRGRGGD